MNESSTFSSPLHDEDIFPDCSSFLSSPLDDDGFLSGSDQWFLSDSDQGLLLDSDQGLLQHSFDRAQLLPESSSKAEDVNEHQQNVLEKEANCEISVGEGEHHENVFQDKSNSSFNNDENVEEPKIGMTFDTIEELTSFYASYGKKEGFGVYKRSSRNSYFDDERKYATISCNRAGKSVSKSKNILNPRPLSKTNCPAKVNAVLGSNKKWKVSKVELKHNHPFSPSKGRFYRCHRVVNRHVKRRLEIFQRAGVRTNKGFNTFVVESGGYENVPFTEKDCRNYIDKVKRLKLGEGDAEAIQSYFTKVQSSDRDFFYTWELDEENRLKSLFWADARCRASYEEFGDVVTFDTTYLTNQYEMPMAPFVGVNHHGQTILLLGCGLISNEDKETFTWLFQSWLACMSGRPPKAIITDQDQAMKNAIQIVFPDARHRWCLWHIMRKLPEKLGSHKKYKFIKYRLKQAVYDSFPPSEFEDAWNTMLERYQLKKNKWLISLYLERHRWVPCYVKDTFWAGMSTTQRSESINAFFDKYVNKKTTLKQFVEQYENALRDRAEKENKEDFNSYNTKYPAITRYAMEEQMREVFTHAKFKEFRKELTGKMYCGIGSLKSQDGILEYEVIEDVMVNGTIVKKPFVVSFKKGNSEEECDVKCICRLFEFRGMLCRHALTVLTNEKIYSVPSKYILRRWRKDVKRRHTKVKVTYSDWVASDVGRRYDRMCSAFSQVADLASDLEEKCSLVLNRVSEIMSEVAGKKSVLDSFTCTPGPGTSPENTTKIIDPMVVRRKGRPSGKRLKPNVEKIITKMQKKKKILKEDADVEHGCGVDSDLPKKKRSRKGNTENLNEKVHSVSSDTSHDAYVNLQPHYGGFLQSYPMQHHPYHVQTEDMPLQVSPHLQNVGFQVQNSSVELLLGCCCDNVHGVAGFLLCCNCTYFGVGLLLLLVCYCSCLYGTAVLKVWCHLCRSAHLSRKF